MAARQPAQDELPREFAVFPLSGALLLPGGRLPLNIFEPRYLAMVEDALGAGRMFGMIQPDIHAQECANGPAMYQVGCLGRVVHFSETEDGRYLITLAGVSRFWVRRELAMGRGYRRVEADFSRFPDDMVTQKLLLGGKRAEILAALRGYFEIFGFSADWAAIEGMEDGALIEQLAMLCPFAEDEKQALLEAPGGMDRAVDLLALLRIAVHEQDQPPQTQIM
jgi:hypothetical protein